MRAGLGPETVDTGVLGAGLREDIVLALDRAAVLLHDSQLVAC